MMNKNIKYFFIGFLSMLMSITFLLPSIDLKVYAYNKSDDSRVIVSMGDSYSAGEGLHDYYGEELPEKYRMYDQEFLSHRSKNSWPAMLKSKLGSNETMVNQKDNNWFFVAMSGAVTKNIVGDGTALPNPITEEYIEKNKYRFKNYLNRYSYTATGINTFKVESCVPIDFQIDVFENENLKNKEIDYVTMTIGGNDVDFAGIVTTLLHPSCISPNVINDKLSQTYGILPQVQLDLKEVYETVSKKAGEQAHIIVAGYPRLLEPNGKGALISEGEATAVNDAIDVFNKVISTTVNECGDNFSFVSVAEEFAEHAVYSDDPWLYNYEWIIKDDDISDFSLKNGSLVSAASFHPNSKGASKYAELVNNEIERIEKNNNDKEPEKSEEINTKTNNFKNDDHLIEIDGKIICAKTDGIYYKDSVTSSAKKIVSANNIVSMLSNGQIVYYVTYSTTLTGTETFDLPHTIHSVEINGDKPSEICTIENSVELLSFNDNNLFFIKRTDYALSALSKVDVSSGKVTNLGENIIKENINCVVDYMGRIGNKMYFLNKSYSSEKNKDAVISYDLTTEKSKTETNNLSIDFPYNKQYDDKLYFVGSTINDNYQKSNSYLYIINSNNELSKSVNIPTNMNVQIMDSNCEYVICFNDEQSDNNTMFDLYRIDLKTEKITTSNGEASRYKNKNYFVTYDLTDPKNIYFMYNLGLYDKSTNKIINKKCDDFAIDISKYMWIINGYVVDWNLNTYKIYEETIETPTQPTEETITSDEATKIVLQDLGNDEYGAVYLKNIEYDGKEYYLIDIKWRVDDGDGKFHYSHIGYNIVSLDGKEVKTVDIINGQVKSY